MTSSDHRVIVVGGGPVGGGLAVELGQRGVSTAVIERRMDPQPIPKGQNLTQRTMEHFVSWGIEERIRAARKMPYDYPNSGVTAYVNLMGPYAHPWWRRSQVGDYYAAANERIPQYETERVLRERMVELPDVDLHLGWSVEKVREHDDGVTVTAVHTESGEERLFRGDFVVGCDGSHSTVRGGAGIGQELSDHDRRMVLLVFRSAELSALLAERFPRASFFSIMDPALDGYWKFLGRVDATEEWFFHAPVPSDVDREDYDFARLVREAVGAHFECEFDHIGFWDLRFAVAETYRKGRVFLAGDSAHSHPPYGGYGINTGFEDARNLGWKLAATLGGWGSPKLLDTYDSERRPIFRSTADDFIEKMIIEGREFLRRFDPDRDRDAFEEAWAERNQRGTGVVDFEPHYEGSSIVFGPPGAETSAKGAHAFVARPGHHLAPRPLSSGESVYDELGSDFTLLGFDPPDGSVERFRRAAADLGVPLEVITDSYSDERKDYETRLILVRPDHYVSWVGDEADDAVGVLARSVGR